MTIPPLAGVQAIAASPAAVRVLVHAANVNAVAFSPDGRRLTTASDDRTARIWDAATGQERTRVVHGGAVLGVAFSPDGRWLATASGDGTAVLWGLS
ncbi:MAG TPA: hypothetical protein VG276_07090 [Actinomycetes bacterium]|nr:hypothetical protein [Actinomycetes bacterium]